MIEALRLERRMFVTSAQYNGDLVSAANGLPGGEFEVTEGLLAADYICEHHATLGGWVGTYRAWLSTTTVNVRNRLGPQKRLPFVSSSHPTFTIAVTEAHLLDGDIEGPLNHDEFGEVINFEPFEWAWTATDGAGRYVSYIGSSNK